MAWKDLTEDELRDALEQKGMPSEEAKFAAVHRAHPSVVDQINYYLSDE